MSKQKIVYICGLGHSGSTILDMSLGAHSQIVGLGELKTLFSENRREKHFKSYCSCGKLATECSFWKDIPEVLNGIESEEKKYDAILSRITGLFGEGTILADSSKNSYSYLKKLDEKYDLKVLFLTRDIRSWSYTRHLSTRKPYLYFGLRWHLENIKLLGQLRKMNIRYMKVGYEELAIYPEFMLKLIADHIEVGFEEKMLVPDLTKSHIISGNVARAVKEKRSRWIYDARWMLSRRVALWSMIMLVFHRRNKNLVYSNIGKQKIKDFHLFGTNIKEEMSQRYN